MFSSEIPFWSLLFWDLEPRLWPICSKSLETTLWFHLQGLMCPKRRIRNENLGHFDAYIQDHFVTLRGQTLLTVQFRICAIRKFDSGSTYGYHNLCRCMEPHCSGGPKMLLVYQFWCQIYFLCKFVHCTVCIVSSGLRVRNTTKTSFALD